MEVVTPFGGTALLAAAAAIGFPIATAWIAIRDRRGRPVHPHAVPAVYGVGVIIIGGAPLIASLVTPDWSPVSMLLASLALWVPAGWAMGFLLGYRRGAGALAATAWGFGGAIVAPLLGTVSMLSRCGVV